MAQALPRGYHFTPTEEELIDILLDFLRGKPLPSTPVVEKALYGQNAIPWNIFSEDDPWQLGDGELGKKGAKKVIYVFTQLSSMSAKKIARTAGCGTWDGQTGSTNIKNSEGQIIGTTKTLTFRVKGESNEENGHWIMHEYALAGESLRNFDPNNYVICKITRDYSKCYKGEVLENPRNNPVLGKTKAAAVAKAADSENSNTSKRFKNNAIGNTKKGSDSALIDSDSAVSIAAEVLVELPNTAGYVAKIKDENSEGQFNDETSTCSNSATLTCSDSATPIAAEELAESIRNTANYVEHSMAWKAWKKKDT